MSLIKKRDFVKDVSVLDIFVYFAESLSFIITFPFNLETRILLFCFKKPIFFFWFRRIMCMHAKLLQSFLTLCYPMDCSPPGFSVLGILYQWNSPGKNTGVDCHALLQGNFSTQKLNLRLLCLTALAGGFFTYWVTWEAPRRIKPTHSRESAKYRREWRCCFSLYRHFIVSVWVKTSLCIQVIRLKTGWKEWEKLLTFVEHSKYRIDEIVSLQYACPCVGGGVGGSYIKLTMTDFMLLIWK